MCSHDRQHASQDLEPQRLLVTQSVGPALDDTDRGVQSLDESQRDRVFGLAVSGDSLPVPIDHLSECLVGLQALPLQAHAPVLEESPHPAFSLVAPQLAEGLLEQVGGVQPCIGCQQGVQRVPALQGEVLAAREQGGVVTRSGLEPETPCLKGRSSAN